MRIVLKSRKRVTLLGVSLAAASIALIGCSTSTKTAANTSNVPCDKIATQQSAANSAATLAQASASSAQASASAAASKGGPDAKNAKDAAASALASVSQAVQNANDLASQADKCNKSSQSNSSSDGVSASPSSTSSASSGEKSGKTSVVNANGKVVTVPFVSGGSVNNGDTTNDPAMPALSKLLPNCGTLTSWASLVDCVNKHHATWYVAGVNKYAAYTGFNWSDVQKWAKAKTVKGETPEQRVIFLTGSMVNLSDAQAQTAVSDLVGSDVAKHLQVVRVKGSAFMNTWRTSGSSPAMTDFADYNSEARVTLMPELLNSKNQVLGLNKDLMFDGVFVDCYNVHGLYPSVPSTPGSPLLCPPGTSKAGQHMPPGGPSQCSPPPSGCTSCSAQPNCTPTPGVESCGKHSSYAPPLPNGEPVVTCANGYLDRNSGQCVNHPYNPPSSSSNGGNGSGNGGGQGQGDSGSGTTNTTTAPLPSATATAPITSSPPTNPPTPPPGG